MLPRILVPLLVLLVLAAAPARAATGDPELREFVFFAVLERLYDLSLPDDVVKRILEVDPATRQPRSFVYACPLCHPTYDALNLYLRRPALLGSKDGARDFAEGGDPALVADLSSANLEQRTRAVGRLVKGAVARRIAASRWTPEERSAWANRLQLASKEGEKQLESHRKAGIAGSTWMKHCEICEGATDACPPAR